MLLIALAIVLNPVMGTNLMFKVFKKYLREQAKKDDFNLRINSTQVTEKTFRTILSKLKKEGLAENPKWGFWKISLKGKKLVDEILEKERSYKNFKDKYSKNRDTIIIFDIPEDQRQKRDGLRTELVALGFEKLQLSVWIGGSPLPKQFMDYLKNNDLLNNVHIFSIKNSGTISN